MRLVEAVEDATERDGRIRDVGEPRLVHLAEASVEIDELEVVGRGLDAHLEDLGEVGPAFDREVDAIEVGERLGVEGLDGEDVAVGLDRLVDVAELVLERLREPAPDGALDVRVVVEAEDVGVRVGEGLPAAVDRTGEARGLFTGLLVERELLQRADVDLEGLHGIDELVFEDSAIL